MDDQCVYFLEENFLLIFADDKKKAYQGNVVRNVIKNL